MQKWSSSEFLIRKKWWSCEKSLLTVPEVTVISRSSSKISKFLTLSKFTFSSILSIAIGPARLKNSRSGDILYSSWFSVRIKVIFSPVSIEIMAVFDSKSFVKQGAEVVANVMIFWENKIAVWGVNEQVAAVFMRLINFYENSISNLGNFIKNCECLTYFLIFIVLLFQLSIPCLDTFAKVSGERYFTCTLLWCYAFSAIFAFFCTDGFLTRRTGPTGFTYTLIRSNTETAFWMFKTLKWLRVKFNRNFGSEMIFFDPIYFH